MSEHRKLKIIQIVDADGDEILLCQTSMTEQEITQALGIYDDSINDDLIDHEKLNKYSEEINKFFERIYIDQVVSV